MVREDPDGVGAPADLAVKPLVGVVGPDLLPQAFGKTGERQDIFTGKSVGVKVASVMSRSFGWAV